MNRYDSLKTFVEKIKRIKRFALSHGIDSVNLVDGEMPKKDFYTFIQNVHVGWDICQNMVYEEINKLEKNILSEKEIFIRKNILMDIINAIVYQMVNGDEVVFRKLYGSLDVKKSLLHSNSDFVLKTINALNRKNRSIFYLMTDLSSAVNFGDCLLIERGNSQIIEFKSGKINKKLLFEQIDGRHLSTSEQKQKIRISKQKEKNTTISQNLLKEKHTFKFKGENITRLTTYVPEQELWCDMLEEKIQNFYKSNKEEETFYNECIGVNILKSNAEPDAILNRGNKKYYFSNFQHNLYHHYSSAGTNCAFLDMNGDNFLEEISNYNQLKIFDYFEMAFSIYDRPPVCLKFSDEIYNLIISRKVSIRLHLNKAYFLKMLNPKRQFKFTTADSRSTSYIENRRNNHSELVLEDKYSNLGIPYATIVYYLCFKFVSPESYVRSIEISERCTKYKFFYLYYKFIFLFNYIFMPRFNYLFRSRLLKKISIGHFKGKIRNPSTFFHFSKKVDK